MTVNGLEARHFCSQGQVRTAALSLKLADREIHKTAIGEYPVMLLDDVLSELDPRRPGVCAQPHCRRTGVHHLLRKRAAGMALLSGRVYHVREGKVP